MKQDIIEIVFLILRLIFKCLFLFAFLFIGVMCGFIIIQSTFGNKEIDTTPLTNFGFAILAGCATVCFSWVRTFDPSEETISLQKIIRFNGERCFLGAISFLFASLFKYVSLNKVIIFKATDSYNWFFNTMNTISQLLFIYAFLMGCAGLYEIGDILFERHVKKTPKG